MRNTLQALPAGRTARLGLVSGLLATLGASVGCYSPACPGGFHVQGGRCLEDDAGSHADVDGSLMDDGGPSSAPDGAADGMAELSDAEGETGPETGAPCEHTPQPAACGTDTSFACATSCGSSGHGTCSASCELSCTPPVEACNYADDNCDGKLDEGLRSLHLEDTNPGPSVRSWVFADGPQPLILLQNGLGTESAASTLSVLRLGSDGLPQGSAQPLMSTPISSLEYAVASAGPNLVIVWVEVDAVDTSLHHMRGRIVRRSDLTDVVAPRTLASGPGMIYPGVAAGAGHIVITAGSGTGIIWVVLDSGLGNSSGPLLLPNSALGRSQAIALPSEPHWMLAFAAAFQPGPTEIVLQSADPATRQLGAALRVTQTPDDPDADPWLAFDGNATLALTFNTGNTGAMNLLLYRLADLREPTAVPFARSVLPAGAGPCPYDLCRSNVVAWAGGAWLTVHKTQVGEQAFQTQLRVFDEAAQLVAGGSPPILLDPSADNLSHGPHAARSDNGQLLIVVPAAGSTRLSRWGCF